MVDKIGTIAKNWKEQFSPPKLKQIKQSQKNLVRATQFTNHIKLDHEEKKLVPSASVTYKKPKSIGILLTNFIAKHTETQSNINGSSSACGRCAICGHKGKH